MQAISPSEARNAGWIIVDVRSAGERAVARVPGSIHAPLERVDLDTSSFPPGRIALLCKAGTRARLAQARLSHCGIDAAVIEGGIDRWQREGLPVSSSTVSRWSLERQVRFGAGALVVAFTLLAALVSPWFLLCSGLVGGGLVFAGATDICMMGNLLARMPWNRIRSGG